MNSGSFKTYIHFEGEHSHRRAFLQAAAVATGGALMGGNVRVGLEDSLYIGKGELAESNAQQVKKIRHILEELGLEIATPAEARQMLKLKGANQVAF